MTPLERAVLAAQEEASPPWTPEALKKLRRIARPRVVRETTMDTPNDDEYSPCRQCLVGEAGKDGFCSDECAEKYAAQLAGEAEDDGP